MALQNRLSFVTPPRPVNEEQLRASVAALYGPAHSWVVLPGESDLNVRVGLADQVGMLKISAEDGTGFARFQTQLTAHLARTEFQLPVPGIIPTLADEENVLIEEGFDAPVHARMTTFLPGVPAREVGLGHVLLHAIGVTLARLHTALATFEVALPERHTNWDMRRPTAHHHSVAPPGAVPAAEHAQWKKILEEFAAVHLPRLSKWPAQLIHNDLNGSNLLIEPAESKVSAVLDTGDVNIGPRIVDIGIAAAYLVDASSPESMRQTLAALVSGYDAVTPLDEEEVAFIPHVMKARYAMALMLNSARAEFAADNPAYVAYVTRNSEAARRRLATLLAQL